MSDLVFENSEELNNRLLALPQAQVQKAARNTAPLAARFNNVRKEEEIQRAMSTIKNTSTQLVTTQNKNTTILDALKKAPQEVYSDRDYMLEAIKKNHNAFEYASKELKRDPSFLVAAIQTNPAVYAHLSLEQKMDPTFHEMYMKKVLGDATVQTIGGQTRLIPKQGLDKDYPIDVKRDGQNYEQCLKKLRDSIDDPRKTLDMVTVDKDFTKVALVNARASQDPELAKEIGRERKLIAQSPTEIEESLKLASRDRRDPKVDAYLTEMTRQNPHLTRKYEDQQKELWTSREKQAEVLRAYKKVHTRPKEIARHEQDIDEQKKNEQTLNEARKRLKTVSMEDSLAEYIKGAYKDYILSLQSAGRISEGEADLYIGMISSISSPSLLHATVNDFDNGDFHMTATEIDRAAENAKVSATIVEANLDSLYVVMQDAHTATKNSLYNGYDEQTRKQDIERYLEDPEMVQDEQRRQREQELADVNRKRKTIHNSRDFMTIDYGNKARERIYV